MTRDTVNDIVSSASIPLRLLHSVPLSKASFSQHCRSVASDAMDTSQATAHGLTTAEIQLLSTKAIAAKDRAYCPYSKFHVGCAVLLKDSSTAITGANVENAAYPVGTCAERVAFGTAIASGLRHGAFKAIAVATNTDKPCSPCGMCRQFIREFCDKSTPIFMFYQSEKYAVKTLGELLPMSFGPEDLMKFETT